MHYYNSYNIGRVVVEGIRGHTAYALREAARPIVCPVWVGVCPARGSEAYSMPGLGHEKS